MTTQKEHFENKINNCLKLLFLLIIKESLTIGQITLALNVTDRTVYRYIKAQIYKSIETSRDIN
jgi:transcriptional antiterminator